MAKRKPVLDVAEVLERAADLIEPEGAWTRQWSARDAIGNETFALSRTAKCWCATGAIIRAAGFDGPELALVFEALGSASYVLDFNDAPGREQAEVVAMLREGAAQARAHLSPSVQEPNNGNG